MTHAEVRALLTPLDSLHQMEWNTSEYWRIGTRPTSLLSVEWVVLMQFDEDGNLLGATVGTYDDVTAPPPEHPPESVGNVKFR